jgi:D-3-phosphoglycerate dehydrogenase
MKIVITDWGFPTLRTEEQLFSRAGVTLEAFQCKTDEDVARVVTDADVVMTQWAPVRSKAIGAMQRCRGIVRYGIGLDNVDLDAARDRAIPVRNVPDYCLDEVADHTMALLLALQRQVCSVFELVRRGTWKITPPVPLPPLRENTLGLLGFGRIGRLVARRALAFGMKVIASDPLATADMLDAAGVIAADTETVFRAADILSLHCPLTVATRHIVGEKSLDRLRQHALLVNTSRGGLVDTAALVKALSAGRIAGAALDVLEEEPVPAGHPILTFPNVIVTSHTAWYSSRSVEQLQRKAAHAALDMLGIRV